MSAIKDIYNLINQAARNGRVRSEEINSKTNLIGNTGYFPGGSIAFTYFLLEGQLHGKGAQWFDNGQLKCEENFHKGHRHGLCRRWHASGQIYSEGCYVNGACEGRFRFWFKNGRQKYELNYALNRLDGECIEWNENGLVKEQGRYEAGLKHGIWKEYTRQEERQQIYIRGVACQGRIQRLVSARKLQAKDILKIDNTALRRVCLENFGYARLLSYLPYDIIDKQIDTILIKMDWHRDEEPLYLVKVRCPSTGTFYALRVPPDMRTVKEAVAWTFGFSSDEYVPTLET